ncbi:hypothetical protein [Streptomyces sp. NPDC005799]|uniref:hypothetical protein n=1 Tax=Streptomyces sp. NPDC005799 TaxID=3154678 RepID=UPI0033CA68C5
MSQLLARLRDGAGHVTDSADMIPVNPARDSQLLVSGPYEMTSRFCEAIPARIAGVATTTAKGL